MGWWRPSRRAGGRSSARSRRRAGHRFLSRLRPSRRTRGVVARVAGLRSLLSGGPRPEFREKLRADLMRAHAAERAAGRHAAGKHAAPPAASPGPRPRRSLLVRLRPVLVFCVLLAAMFGTGVRTYHAVPGEALYPLKRMAESTVLRLAYDEEELTQRQMVAARHRAAETASLVDAASPERRRLIGQTLDDLETTTRAALSRVVREGHADGAARKFAREQRNLVEPLLPKLDGENRDKANQYLIYIESFTGSGR
ncbi:hypothetical protein FLW53_14965 [Microbispora sp. SCL1-1]|uniref:DUF5667 domain-containing protein n=1 Tax=unclassified Microbispora TaxID=2614687 RepID=UPI001159C811|nr:MULTISPECIES: DUF5667 domain-containing protein [unclassified Microbispora]NJP25472.1 hypothetical protein [Microbispora sp. CL1-1]TQS13433.1 hypothetical protein FLW53_14965 [Microbispora sp. SCL1-1]